MGRKVLETQPYMQEKENGEDQRIGTTLCCEEGHAGSIRAREDEVFGRSVWRIRCIDP